MRKCKICQEEKEVAKFQGKKWGKICKNCVGFIGHQNVKKKYRTDPEFRNKILERGRQWRVKEENKKKVSLNKIEYEKNNREKINAYKRNLYKTNARFKLGVLIRSRLRDFVTGKSKTTSALVLLGCSLDELKKYIENQFKEGMSWDNFGKWQIDHIRPCTSFDLTNIEEQKKCFNYMNLQPLWKKDNVAKGARFIF